MKRILIFFKEIFSLDKNERRMGLINLEKRWLHFLAFFGGRLKRLSPSVYCGLKKFFPDKVAGEPLSRQKKNQLVSSWRKAALVVFLVVGEGVTFLSSRSGIMSFSEAYFLCLFIVFTCIVVLLLEELYELRRNHKKLALEQVKNQEKISGHLRAVQDDFRGISEKQRTDFEAVCQEFDAQKEERACDRERVDLFFRKFQEEVMRGDDRIEKQIMNAREEFVKAEEKVRERIDRLENDIEQRLDALASLSKALGDRLSQTRYFLGRETARIEEAFSKEVLGARQQSASELQKVRDEINGLNVEMDKKLDGVCQQWEQARAEVKQKMVQLGDEIGGLHMEMEKKLDGVCQQWEQARAEVKQKIVQLGDEIGGLHMEMEKKLVGACQQWEQGRAEAQKKIAQLHDELGALEGEVLKKLDGVSQKWEQVSGGLARDIGLNRSQWTRTGEELRRDLDLARMQLSGLEGHLDRNAKSFEKQVQQFQTETAIVQRKLKSYQYDYRQIEALFSMVSLLKIERPLPPMRSWAISPDVALLLFELVREKRPKLILEFGSGVSTIIMAYVLKSLGYGRIVSVEHDKDYQDLWVREIKAHALQDIVQVVHAPLEDLTLDNKTWTWYQKDVILKSLKAETIDILFVDGPPGGVQSLSRYPALPVFEPFLKQDSVVVLDDAGRDDERAILGFWTQMFPSFQCQYRDSEKGAAVLTRPKTQ